MRMGISSRSRPWRSCDSASGSATSSQTASVAAETRGDASYAVRISPSEAWRGAGARPGLKTPRAYDASFIKPLWLGSRHLSALSSMRRSGPADRLRRRSFRAALAEVADERRDEGGELGGGAVARGGRKSVVVHRERDEELVLAVQRGDLCDARLPRESRGALWHRPLPAPGAARGAICTGCRPAFVNAGCRRVRRSASRAAALLASARRGRPARRRRR